jgi:hypothetical protein
MTIAPFVSFHLLCDMSIQIQQSGTVIGLVQSIVLVQ